MREQCHVSREYMDFAAAAEQAHESLNFVAWTSFFEEVG
jgi:hypothetical protein